MADELPLPRLAWNPAAESLSNAAARKRVRLSSPAVSSDPAIFSSDDDPSADNYTQERRKRKYRGPWYRQQPESEAGMQGMDDGEQPKKVKRLFERQFDSGVFMGSDGTDAEEQLEDREFASIASLPVRQSRGKLAELVPPTPEQLARAHIESCCESGTETIDLSTRNLTSLSNAAIRPLGFFTRIPRSSSTDVYLQLEPKLKLFLSSNRLSQLPGELFSLRHLAVLSLRDNEILELPPSIGKLTRLRELNLSQNGLRYLPYEILNLLKVTSELKELRVHPNLFYAPQFTSAGPAEDEVPYKIGLGNRARKSPFSRSSTRPGDDTRWHTRWDVKYRIRTEVRFLSITGKLVKGPLLPTSEVEGSQPSTNSLPLASLEDAPKPPSNFGLLSRVPSLIEVSLAACSRSPQLPILGSLLPVDSGPYLHRILIDAAYKKESGGSRCTICERSFVIPRTEWIEWWQIAKASPEMGISAASPLRQMENERDALESMVPLIRRGCSWLCTPEKMLVIEE